MKKWLFYVGQYKNSTLFTLVGVATEVIIDILIPRTMANIIDKGIGDGNMDIVTKTGLTLILMCLCSLLSGVLTGHFAAKASAGFAKNLRREIFYQIQGFSFAKIDKFSTSSLITRLTTDVSTVQNSFQMIIRTCVRSPLMIIFSMTMVFSINKQLAWIFVGVLPVLIIGLAIIMTKANPIFSRVFKMYDNLNRVVEENLHGIRVVKSYVGEESQIEKFEEASGDLYNNFVSAEKILAFNNPLMQFSMYTCTLLICWLGAKAIVSRTLTTGQLISLLAYSTQILISLMILSMVFVSITMSKASMERISEILNEENDIINGSVTKLKDGSIVFKNVSFGYGGKDKNSFLQNIDINIKSGQTVGIIGGTGSGKSSLIQLIPRLYDATEGEVIVGGVNVKDYDVEFLRHDVSVVLQKNLLFSGTIRDNLKWGNKNATDKEIEEACELAQANEFIKNFPDKYDTWLEQGGNNLSGGQKQRLCLARALLKKAKILILDDSTSAVDTNIEALIRQAFKEKISNTTKIIIAQRISSIQEAEQIIVMENGEISAVGSHNDLLETNSIYQEVYNSQQKGGLANETF